MKNSRSILVFTLAILAGCTHMRELKEVESYIDSAPDSALAVLNKIPIGSCISAHSRAYRALLESEALDKSFIDLTDDSLIRPAISAYYSSHGPAEERMRAYYYMGRVRQNASDFAGAIISFQEAGRLAEECGDRFYSGMIFRAMSNVYDVSRFRGEALSYMRKAKKEFIAAGKPLHAQWAALDEAFLDYEGGTAPEGATRLLDSLLSLPDIDVKVRSEAELLKASILANSWQDEAAISLFRKAAAGGARFKPVHYADMAFSLLRTGQRDSVGFYMEKAREGTDSEHGKKALLFWEYRMERQLGHPDKALPLLEEAAAYQDSLYYGILNQSVLASQRDAYKRGLEQARTSMRAKTTAYGLLILLLAAAIAIAVLLYRQKADRLERALAQAESLRADLKSMEGYGELSLLNKLSGLYYDRNSAGNGSLVLKQLEKDMNSIKAELTGSAALEELLNAKYDGIMEHLRDEIPLTRYEFRLLSYYFSGLSTSSIRFLTEESVSNIYKLKSRLKDRISATDAPHGQEFLKLLK